MQLKLYRREMYGIQLFLVDGLTLVNNMEQMMSLLEQEKLESIHEIRLWEIIGCVRRGFAYYGLLDGCQAIYQMSQILKLVLRKPEYRQREYMDALFIAIDFMVSYIKKISDIMEQNPLIDLTEQEYYTVDLNTIEINWMETLSHIYKEEISNMSVGQESLQENEFDRLLSDSLSAGLSTEIKEQFIYETLEHVDLIEIELLIRLEQNQEQKEIIHEIFRHIHSIKGAIGLYHGTLSQEDPNYSKVKIFMDTVHSYESLLSLVRDKNPQSAGNYVDISLTTMDYIRECVNGIAMNYNQMPWELGPRESLNDMIAELQEFEMKEVVNKEKESSAGKSCPSNQSIRVHQDKIDGMMNMISELVIAKNSFAHISNKLSLHYNLPELSKEVRQVGANVNRISDELQNSIMSIRMVEIRSVFQKMPRIIRDIAQSNGKKIELIMEGETTEIDKSIVESISDPLVHIIRNSADHGIETIDERNKKGKPEVGKIVLRAYNKNKFVFIEIEDDGKGIDPNSIKEKAIEKGIISTIEAAELTNNELIQLIFVPGFSMADKITEVSGRGVGMDIVKSNITKIHGTISVSSQVDQGTKMTIRLPLSLAVSHGLMVRSATEHYMIPLDYVVETVKISPQDIHQFNGKYFTQLRGNVIGLDWLSRLFQITETEQSMEELNAVIVSNGVEQYGIIVDKLMSEQEYVMKPLQGELSSIPGISGSTLLGDGQVILIVNPLDLMEMDGL